MYMIKIKLSDPVSHWLTRTGYTMITMMYTFSSHSGEPQSASIAAESYPR